MVEKRARFELEKARKRLHLVDGFLLAMRSMDQIVNAIREAKDGEAAMSQLQNVFALTKEQAEGVMSLTLRRLTSMENQKLEEEQATLRTRYERMNHSSCGRLIHNIMSYDLLRISCSLF